jgi:putative transposase
VLDVFSRLVVGWSIDSSVTATLVTSALGMAIDRRCPNGTVIHSDQGVQFTSWAFTQRLKDAGLVPSMGSVGDCYDNAVIESFWSRMQVELLDRKRWTTPHRAGHRDLRIPRDLPQPSAPPLSA